MSTHEKNDASVSVIIPTTCEKHRAEQLRRAIESVIAQNIRALRCIVVVNGPRVDPETLNILKQENRISVIEQEVGSLPIALQTGRKHVTSEYFSILDDDDELLPGSLEARLDSLSRDNELAAVISNGYILSNGQKKIFFDIKKVSKNPLASLFNSNWLASCGATYRTSLVPADYFSVQYYEWTYVAFLLALEHKIKFIDYKGFLVNQDTPGSLSKSDEYSDRYPKFVKILLAYPVPNDVQRILNIKLGRALHCNAERLRSESNMIAAWRSHFESLLCAEGWKYVLYTRKLVASSLRKFR